MATVAIVACPDYERSRVAAAVERALSFVGGIGAFVKPGMKVLIKPNLLSVRTPDEGVTTHPELVRAVVRLVKTAGGTVFIGDAPGGYGENIDEIFTATGMRQVAAEEGATLVAFTASRCVEGMPFTKYLFECDRIISLPKFKTHGVTVITAAVKNMYGALVGPYKAEQHSVAPRPDDFAKILVRTYRHARPHLSIVDAVVAMEGDGPAAGVPRTLGFVMAGTDAVAIDTCLATAIGLHPFDVDTTKEAYAAALGEADPSRIEIVGDGLDRFAVRDFRMPRTMFLRTVPRWALKAILSFVNFKPAIDTTICRRCNLCTMACPVKAIEIGKRCRIDYRKCVRCLCCQEVCPHKAIEVRRNLLTRIVWG